MQSVPMFGIEPTDGDAWTIVDEDQQVVFVGSLRACEDWLDYQDNAHRSPSRLAEWLRRLWARLGRRREVEPHPSPQPNEDSAAVPPRLAS